MLEYNVTSNVFWRNQLISEISCLVPKVKNAVKGEDVGEHSQDPRDGVQVRDEADAVQMVKQDGIVEGLHVRELGQVLLNNSGVVFAKHAVQVPEVRLGSSMRYQTNPALRMEQGRRIKPSINF